MTDVLMYADTLRSPDLRHIISIPIGDAFPFVERDGKPTAFVHAVEEPRIRELGGIEIVTYGELGLAELTEQGFSYQAARIELLVRACRHVRDRRGDRPRRTSRWELPSASGARASRSYRTWRSSRSGAGPAPAGEVEGPAGAGRDDPADGDRDDVRVPGRRCQLRRAPARQPAARSRAMT